MKEMRRGKKRQSDAVQHYSNDMKQFFSSHHVWFKWLWYIF